ncbi:MAG: nucleotidyltransferase substrate binding protein [bacterium]
MNTAGPALDVRWKQRFENYQKALGQLRNAVVLSRQRALSELELQGLIQAFEFTHELAWNVIKDYFEYQGNTTITGSRDATREAFQQGLITDGEAWMGMIRSRNRASHTYHAETAREIVRAVTDVYCVLFDALEVKMKLLAESGG